MIVVLCNLDCYYLWATRFDARSIVVHYFFSKIIQMSDFEIRINNNFCLPRAIAVITVVCAVILNGQMDETRCVFRGSNFQGIN